MKPTPALLAPPNWRRRRVHWALTPGVSGVLSSTCESLGHPGRESRVLEWALASALAQHPAIPATSPAESAEVPVTCEGAAP